MQKAVLTVTFLLLPGILLAQPRAKAQSQFKLSSETQKLTPRYQGKLSTLVAVYRVRSEYEKKGEYETGVEYAARIRRLNDFGQKESGGPGPFGVVMEPDVIDYDADQELFKITGEFSTHGLLVRTAERAGKAYIGQNAFGVKRRIQTRAYRNLYVTVENRNQLPLEFPGFALENLVLRLKMPRLEAIRRKSGVRLLLLGDMVEPFYRETSEESTPTIDDPIHSITVSMVIHMKLSAIWLFDYSTGHIWAKMQVPYHEPTDSSHEPTDSSHEPTVSTLTSLRTVVGEVGKTDLAAYVVRRVNPPYPKNVDGEGASGVVEVRITVDAGGNVLGAEALSGYAFLRQTAVQASLKWKFKPDSSVSNGQVRVGNLRFEFK